MWEEEALRRGVHCLRIMTTDKINVDFYKKKGFILFGSIPKEHFGLRAFLFYKIIQEPKEKNYLDPSS